MEKGGKGYRAESIEGDGLLSDSFGRDIKWNNPLVG
jgi:hypothetical protein